MNDTWRLSTDARFHADVKERKLVTSCWDCKSRLADLKEPRAHTHVSIYRHTHVPVHIYMHTHTPGGGSAQCTFMSVHIICTLVAVKASVCTHVYTHAHMHVSVHSQEKRAGKRRPSTAHGTGQVVQPDSRSRGSGGAQSALGWRGSRVLLGSTTSTQGSSGSTTWCLQPRWSPRPPGVYHKASLRSSGGQ